MTYPKEVEETIGIPIEVEPLDETQLENLGLNTCNHGIPLSSREVSSFDEPEPQPQPLPSYSSLDVSLGKERDLEPPIKPHSSDSFRMNVIDNLTIHTPLSPHVASFHPKDVLEDDKGQRRFLLLSVEEKTRQNQGDQDPVFKLQGHDRDSSGIVSDKGNDQSLENQLNTSGDESSRTLGESNSVRDSCLVALQNKQTEFERYKAFNDRTVNYDKLERKLNETLGLLAQKAIDIKEGLKVKAYEISVVKEKHDELVKQSLLTKSHYEGLVKEKTKNDSFAFVHELKKEMHADLKHVESLENEIDELESDKAEFSNMYDMLLQECVSNDVMCSYLHSLSDLDAHVELQCLYDHKVTECECLAQKLLKQTESVSKEVYTELLRSFAKLEKHSISLELALQ
ncbi:hypothetical protein Tco_1532966 [Tanacetum coccineum]